HRNLKRRFGNMAPTVGHPNHVRVDQSTACDRGHLLDGWHALSTAAVRLSLRGRGRLEAVRDLQGDGKPAPESDHQSCDGRDLACRALSGVGWPLVCGRLVSPEVSTGAGDVRCPRLFCPLR